MSIKIVKRSGLKDDYDLNKIFNVLLKAATHIGYTVEDKTLTPELLKDLNEITGSIDDEIQDEYVNSETPVSVVQNIVMDHLLNSDYKDIAKEYISYSAQREQIHKDMMNTEKAVDRVLSKDPSVVNENGNKDSRHFPTRRDMIAGQVFKAKGLEMLPKDVREAHLKGDIHFHDLDMSPLFPYTNCCNVNLADMLENGFNLGEVVFTQPHSLDVAVQLTSLIMNSVSLSQYGGTSVPNIDRILAPYAKMNYDKHLDNAMKYQTYDPENVAWELTKHDIYEDMQGLEYAINSMTASGAQVPFTTLSMSGDTDRYAREIQLAMLKVREAGMPTGNGTRSAIFPKLVYIITKGKNYYKEDPNYDVTQEALKCSSIRDYPDIVFADNMLEITGGKDKVMTSMGCVSGEEIITYMDSKGEHTIPIDRFYDKFKVAEKLQPNGIDMCIDVDNIKIKDSHKGKVEYVDCKRIIKNSNNKWLRLKFTNGRILECTDDHPLEIIGKGRVLAKDLVEGDEIQGALDVQKSNDVDYFSDEFAWLLGDIICDGCLDKTSETLISYAFTGEDEIRNKIGETVGEDKLRDKDQHRYEKGDYKEVAIKDHQLHDYLVNVFGGTNKIDRHIPEFIFSAPEHSRLAFYGGMIDADGYLNEKSQRIQIGSTSKRLANGQMLLAESLGIRASMIINHYSKKDPKKVRYRVEFRVPEKLIPYIECEKKSSKYNPNKKTNNSSKRLKLLSIEQIKGHEYSYDVTTSSDYFDVSGVVSHNCRSFLPTWVNPDTGLEQVAGRCNMGVVTLNIPRIAMESNGDKDRFWNIFKQRVELVHKALRFRIDRVLDAKPTDAPILYQYGALARLKPVDDIKQIMTGGRATVSFGYIGLYEMNTVFYGSNWEHNQNAIDFAHNVVQYMHDKCQEWYKDEDFYYSLYSTPAESTTDTLCKADKNKFGIVKDITDKDYYTNSFHYDVRKDVTPFEKLKFEAPYQHIATGGFISYTELPDISHNLSALETVWKYADEVGIGYLGTNVPMDECLNCGFHGQCIETNKGWKCPECGETDQLQIVERLCGYLSEINTRPVVKGRMNEIEHRVHHNLSQLGVAMEDKHVIKRE